MKEDDGFFKRKRGDEAKKRKRERVRVIDKLGLIVKKEVNR